MGPLVARRAQFGVEAERAVALARARHPGKRGDGELQVDQGAQNDHRPDQAPLAGIFKGNGKGEEREKRGWVGGFHE